MAAADHALLDLFTDGIAALAADGETLSPANASMRALLTGVAPALSQLVPALWQRERLLGGEVVDVQACSGWWQLSLVTTAGSRWLLARNVTEAHRLHGEVLAGERARSLAGIAHSIVHDLGNMLNATVGLCESLQTAGSAEDRAYLANVIQGTRQGAELLRTLARQLHSSPRQSSHFDLDAQVAQVLLVCQKHAVHQGRELQRQPSAPVFVRGVAEDLEYALLQGLLRALESAPSAGPVVIGVGGRVASCVGGRERRFGVVRLGTGAEWIGEIAGDLLRAAMLLRCSGGDLSVERIDGAQWLQLELPEAVR